jgi:RNA polymerase sigma-70 factor (ECF subfamily)
MSDEHTLHLYISHRRKLISFAYGLVGDAVRAEDIVQDAFMRLSEVSRQRSLDNPGGFLYRIVRNLSFDSCRRQTLESRHMQRDSTPDADQVPEERPTPEVELSTRQEVQRVIAAMAAMPERTRIALEMHRLEGAKLKDIATRLGVSVTSAHGLIAEGVQRCRDSLREPDALRRRAAEEGN